MKFKLFAPYAKEIVHDTTDKQFGSLNDKQPEFEKNLARLMKENEMSRPIYLTQVHGDKILNVTEIPETPPDADALITRKPNLPLMIKTADCQAVLIFDPTTNTIAAIHSGWKGSIQNIIGKTIKHLKEMGSSPGDLLVGISPSLGPECSEFSDPKTELPDWCEKYTTGNNVDFWKMSLDQLKKEGVLEKNIENVNICTKCDPNYYSYRQKDDGRMASFIMLKS